jgi:hypothetical protein
MNLSTWYFKQSFFYRKCFKKNLLTFIFFRGFQYENIFLVTGSFSSGLSQGFEAEGVGLTEHNTINNLSNHGLTTSPPIRGLFSEWIVAHSLRKKLERKKIIRLKKIMFQSSKIMIRTRVSWDYSFKGIVSWNKMTFGRFHCIAGNFLMIRCRILNLKNFDFILMVKKYI